MHTEALWLCLYPSKLGQQGVRQLAQRSAQLQTCASTGRYCTHTPPPPQATAIHMTPPADTSCQSYVSAVLHRYLPLLLAFIPSITPTNYVAQLSGITWHVHLLQKPTQLVLLLRGKLEGGTGLREGTSQWTSQVSSSSTNLVPIKE